MFSTETPRSRGAAAWQIAELIYHNTVRTIRKGHRHALMALAMTVLQTLIMLAAFYLMFSLFGMRSMALRGDFIVYLLSGIFIFMINIKTVGAVAGAEGPTSAMMLHAPMNTAIAIFSAALASLYTQILSVILILLAYDLAFGRVDIDDPIGTLGVMILAWANGVAVGMVLLALKPWFPNLTGILSTVYKRMNMFFSGKMFVANQLGFTMFYMFAWNPLFHIIDQARGYAFLNYTPMKTSLSYPIWVSFALFTIGLLGEWYTRQHASASWGKAR